MGLPWAARNRGPSESAVRQFEVDGVVAVRHGEPGVRQQGFGLPVEFETDHGRAADGLVRDPLPREVDFMVLL